MLQRFVLDDMGYKNFGASMLKHLLKRAQEASDEVTELVYVTVLEKKLLWYNQIASYRQISIDQTEWAALQQVLFFLVEDVGKPLLSKKVKGLIGQLLAVLQTSRFDNPDYLYESRRGKKTLAMGAYQASVRYTLFELRKWLDGKEPGKELRLAA
jgi:hypothetical protein